MKKAVTIAVANQKGGVGKSICVINIAAALVKHHNKKVLVIDTDAQHSTSLIFGLLPPFDYPTTFFDVVTDDKEELADCIYKTKVENIDLVPSNLELFAWESKAGSRKSYVGLKDKMTEDVLSQYDFILIDTPPNLNPPLNNALAVADYYIIPIKSEDYFALKGIQQLQEHVSFIADSFNNKLKFMGAVITMHDERTKVAKVMKKAISGFFKPHEIFKTTITRNTALNRANFKQMPILEFDSKSYGAKDFKALAGEIMQKSRLDSDEEKSVSEIGQAEPAR